MLTRRHPLRSPAVTLFLHPPHPPHPPHPARPTCFAFLCFPTAIDLFLLPAALLATRAKMGSPDGAVHWTKRPPKSLIPINLLFLLFRYFETYSCRVSTASSLRLCQPSMALNLPSPFSHTQTRSLSLSVVYAFTLLSLVPICLILSTIAVVFPSRSWGCKRTVEEYFQMAEVNGWVAGAHEGGQCCTGER